MKPKRVEYALPETPPANGEYSSTMFESMATTTASTARARPMMATDESRSRATFSSSTAEKSSSSRVFFLRLADSRKWHYSETIGMFLDFFVQVLAVAFTPKQGTVLTYFSEDPAADGSRYFSSGFMVSYVLDTVIRICGLRSALFRSRSNIADLVCLLAMGGLVGARYVLPHHEFDITLAYVCVLALRLILKPRARAFSKKLHKFRTNGDQIRISIESLRASLARIPGISALSIEMMETDLMIICGRQTGDMSRNELMGFLERALHHRPPTLSATEFLAHLREIDATAQQTTYTVGDVIQSTLSHWSNQIIDLVLSMVVVCINASISPLFAYFLGRLSDAFYIQSRNRKEDWDYGLYHSAFIGILALIVPFVIGDYAIGYFQSKMIAKATERMQNSMLSTILRQNTQFFQDRPEGDLVNLFASDVARVNALWQAVFWNLLNPLIAVAFGFGYALYMKYPIGIIAFAFTGMLLSSGPQGYAGQRSKDFASKNAYVAAEFQNAVNCQKVVRAYRIQEPLLDRFKKMTSLLRRSQFRKDFWSSLVQIYIESAMYIFTAIMMVALAMKVKNSNGETPLYPNDKVKSGDFWGFVTLLQRVANPVTVLGGFMRVAISNASSLQRVDDIIVGLGQATSGNDSDANLPSLPMMQKDLRIEKLVFKYDKTSENYVLNDLSATIPRGSYTCIVGPSGCGKSTLLACLMQFQEADGGCIRLDGHDIFNFSKASFMSQTAVVFQDGGILNGTIYDNIRYGNIHASDRECEEAARLAECHFITDLKDGYETIVGQHATANLSGGQAQRLCLARALCRKPSVLLLDEATSALDPETELSIIGTLERLSSKMNMTILSVTHRLSTTANANQILVMSQGRIAESGRYAELCRQGGLFAEMLHRVEEEEANRTSRKKTMSTDSTANAAFTKRHESVDYVDSTSLALQQFTRTLSTRVSNRSRQQSTDSYTSDRRGANNSSFLAGGRHAANSSASASGYVRHDVPSNTSQPSDDDDRNSYFVL